MAAPTVTAIQSRVAVNAASVAFSLTYTGSNYILLLSAYNEHQSLGPGATITSVVSAGMTWALRKRSNGSAGGALELWWAQGTGNLSAYTVTVNYTGAYDDCSMHIFAVQGCASLSAPFDVNSSLPAALTAPSAAAWTPSFTGISTSSTDDLLLFITGSMAGNSTPATGFTTIDRVANAGGGWASVVKSDRRAVTALQSAATFTHGDTLTSPFGTNASEAIFDALAGTAPAVSARQYAVSVVT